MIILPVPIYQNEEPRPKCPQCGQELPVEGGSILGVAVCLAGGIVIVLGVLSAGWTLLAWACPGYYDGNPTLVEVIIREWHWFTELLGRIW